MGKGKPEKKINKFESFDINRATGDYHSGKLEKLIVKADFQKAHLPHVDLAARPTGGMTQKYRVFDPVAAMTLRNSGEINLDVSNQVQMDAQRFRDELPKI